MKFFSSAFMFILPISHGYILSWSCSDFTVNTNIMRNIALKYDHRKEHVNYQRTT